MQVPIWLALLFIFTLCEDLEVTCLSSCYITMFAT
ncbi:hypothetical protein DAI22_10g101600 [Oryza sativa Japonica Group]|nr:hypothetical protein DAI22_10g101600 [Oryza sativa Japonica Group]